MFFNFEKLFCFSHFTKFHKMITKFMIQIDVNISNFEKFWSQEWLINCLFIVVTLHWTDLTTTCEEHEDSKKAGLPRSAGFLHAQQCGSEGDSAWWVFWEILGWSNDQPNLLRWEAKHKKKHESLTLARSLSWRIRIPYFWLFSKRYWFK